MRRLALCALLALAICPSYGICAQTSDTTAADQSSALPLPSTILPSTTSQQQNQPLIKPPATTGNSPVQPSELPTGYKMPPDSRVVDTKSNYIEFYADEIHTTFEDGKPAITTAQGNVIARFRDMSATADKGTADYKTNIAVFEGGVIFKVGGQEIKGKCVTLNMKTREWSLNNADTTIRPEFTKGHLLAPVFADGQRIWGVKQKEMFGSSTESTTCNLEHPHYELVAKSFFVYPDDKIVMKNVTFYALGHRLFTLPRFVVPLQQISKNPQLIPKIGMTSEEGAYMKYSYPYMGTKAASGFLLLDLMSKKGIGQGIRQTYGYQKAKGDIQLYHIYDNNINKDTLTGKITHNQDIGTLKLNLSSDFRSNSYLYASNSKSLINQLSLTRTRTGADTSLVVNQTVNDAIIRTEQLNATISHKQSFGMDSSFTTSFNYNSYDTGNYSTAKLTSQMGFAQKESKFDWSLSAQKLTDLSDEAYIGSGTFSGIEKLPEIALMSDTGRLGKILPFGMPANFKFSFGEYDELPANTNLARTYFEMNTPAKTRQLSDSWSLVSGGGFKQYVYSDNTAQYSIDTSAELNKKIGSNSIFALTYRYQQPQGYTPFRFDYVGKYNVFNARVDMKESEKVKFSILTGYNFQQQISPWQDMVIRLSLQPTKSFLFYTATGYNANNGQWRSIINQMRIRGGDNFKLDIGSNYNPTQGRLASLRTQLETPIDSKTRISANVGYDGYTNSFDYRTFKITRDLHCWEASISYVDQGGFYTNNGFTFSLRIKAFPSYDNYGVGAYGAALDTSVGEIYGY